MVKGAIVLRHMWVWPRYVRQGGGVRFWWGKVHNDRRARTSRSRSGARVKRALPDGFLIPLLFSRSSAICDVKKPNLIIRSGQVSEFAHSCHSWGSFSGYFQITATQISLEWLFFFTKKKGNPDGESVLFIPERSQGVGSRTL